MMIAIDGCSESFNLYGKPANNRLGGGMRGWRRYAFAVAILISPTAMAATELHGAGFPGAVVGDALAGGVRSALVEGATADQWASAVDAAVFRGRSTAAPSRPKADRFGWTFIMIAFAGLTAVFTGKRTAGRGLFGA